MADGKFTQKGYTDMFDCYFRGQTLPSAFYVALVNDTVVIGDNWSDISGNELPSEKGYTTGGVSLTLDATGFPTLTDDSNDVRCDTKEVSWTASASWGTAATAIVLVADKATDQLVAFANITSVQPLIGETVAWTIKLKLKTTCA